MMVVLVVIACINTCWQTLRAWLPKFLIEGRDYTEKAALYFNSGFFVASDIGCIGAGALALWLARGRLNLHSARMAVFFVCAVLTAFTLFIPALPKGWLLLCVLLILVLGRGYRKQITARDEEQLKDLDFFSVFFDTYNDHQNGFQRRQTIRPVC